MSHSFTKIYIHLIFIVKNRMPLISQEKEEVIHEFMQSQIGKCQSTILSINGTKDHVHVLIHQSPKISISDLVMQVKGATSHWINKNELTAERFSWQTGPRAFSVSYSNLNGVKRYIENQKEHHKKQTIEEEIAEILRLHGL